MAEFTILYFAFSGTSFGGVEQKLVSQLAGFSENGADAKLVLVMTDHPDENFNKIISRFDNIHLLINSENKRNNSLRRRKEKFDLMYSYLSSFNPEKTIIYLRYPGADFFFFQFLKRIRKFKIVTEHQEIENKLRIGCFNGQWLIDINDFIWGKSIRKKITGFVGVSSQCLKIQQSYLNFEQQKLKYGLVNGNGIDVKQFKPRTCPPFDGNTLVLLFVGSLYKSHGFHRVLKSLELALLSNFPVKIIIHVAGSSKEGSYLEKYLRNEKLARQVIFHGFLQQDKIDDLVCQCHIAIASLGLHRIGLHVTSTLKSRHYFATGIPFITSTSDDDFNDNPYIFKLPGNETSFDFQEIVAFTKKITSDSDHPGRMHEFSLQQLDWPIKMRRTIAFLNVVFHGDQISTRTS